MESGSRRRSRLVSSEMRRHAVANAERLDWARDRRDAAISRAERWVSLTDAQLWSLVPSQGVPRDIHTNKQVGCPNCGEGIVPYGNYPWRFDFWQRPWKLTCPNCGETYPKNDFAAFYQSALDEHGFFHREAGDRSLLFNAEHPDPEDPLHSLYVDDGWGMKDEAGHVHTMVAYYCEWAQWVTILKQAVQSLATAFTLTDDPKYAHTCAVLLDRIADVYPDLDYQANAADHGFPSSRPWCEGRIEDRIWECGNGTRLAKAYDAIKDGIQGDRKLVEFCAATAEAHRLSPKDSIDDICAHIEDHLLVEILESTADGRISGNTGMTHECLVAAAIALDRPRESRAWLDRLFDPGFPGAHLKQKTSLPWILHEGLDRDGMGGECGNYGLIWVRRMMSIVDLLQRYPDYTAHDLVIEYPKLRKAFYIEPRLNCLDAAMPPIGDAGNTGRWSRMGTPATFVQGFRLYGDPELAGLAVRYAEGNRGDLRLSRDIFAEDPEALVDALVAAAAERSDRLACDHLGRYGLAVMQTPRAEGGRAMWLHYGYGKGHSHHDSLNLGLYAHNIDMLPDLGYPEYTSTWPKRIGWTCNTISHNTVVVNDAWSRASCGGRLELFAVEPPLRALTVSAPRSYEGVDEYRRDAIMVDVDGVNSYVVDVFRVAGGSNHRLSYHGPAAEAEMSGCELTPQEKGTFAGPDVAFGEFFDGPKNSWQYGGSGFMYLYDVARSGDRVEAPFTVDWKAEDRRGRIAPGHEPHLRLHALDACDEVALASGDPPQNKTGNPKRLRYLVRSNLGDGLTSQFVSVLEPYDRTPFISGVSRVMPLNPVDQEAVAVVRVMLTNGAEDWIISCRRVMRVQLPGNIEFHGRIGLIRLVGGRPVVLRMAHADQLTVGEIGIRTDRPAYEGVVSGISTEDPTDARIALDPPLPSQAALCGRTVHIQNALPLDTSYRIVRLVEKGISTGDTTVVWGLRDPADLDRGFRYLVNPGDRYLVPLTAGLDVE